MGEEDVPHCWCDKQEKLLVKWAEKAAGYRWLHNHARLYYKKQNDRLSYPSIIIASLTGVGGFAVLNPNEFIATLFIFLSCISLPHFLLMHLFYKVKQ